LLNIEAKFGHLSEIKLSQISDYLVVSEMLGIVHRVKVKRPTTFLETATAPFFMWNGEGENFPFTVPPEEEGRLGHPNFVAFSLIRWTLFNF
jgi:hypothetical protein